MTPEKLKSEFYRLACTFYVSPGNERTYVVLSGLNENMPESEAAFKLAKDGLTNRLRTERIIKGDIIWSYINAQDLGQNVDPRIKLYNDIQNMTLKDIADFQKQWVKGRTYVYCILGDKKDLELDKLKAVGLIEELTQEFYEYISKENGTIFLAMIDGCAVGFAQCGLRRDYVEGTDSSPVGYLEGIFVKEEYRKRGVARDMLEACQKWAKGQGCAEFASDCELDNEDSLKFHIKMGFVEANRIICFTKKLKDSVIGRQVTVTVDRPLGSYHLNYKDMD